MEARRKLKALWRGVRTALVNQRQQVSLFLGVCAAALLAVNSNVIVARFYERWDVTSTQVHSLSPPTIEVLKALTEPIEVVVFLSRADPLHTSVRYLLDEYGAHTSALKSRFVDPDRSPAEFVALQREYGVFEGKTENGRLTTDAAVVLVRGERRWFITADDIVAYSEHDARVQPRLEQALTEGLVNITGRESPTVCFTAGQQELRLDSSGPQSLVEFRARLERNNYRVRKVDLASPDPDERLSGCELIIVAGPQVAFAQAAAQRLRRQIERGSSLLIAAGPIVTEDGSMSELGLEPVLSLIGVQLLRRVVFEGDAKLALPSGVGGEVFLASPKRHPSTRGLLRDGVPTARVLMQLAQELTLADGGRARPLLVTSEEAVALSNLGPLKEGSLWQQEFQEGERIVAATAELDRYRPEGRQHGARIAVLGSQSPLFAGTWRQPALHGSRSFVESLISWLVLQPKLVSVPEKPTHPAGLHLTEDSIAEVQRYVIAYVPLTAALVGLLVVVRRRRVAVETKKGDQL